MTPGLLYALTGALLFCLGLYGLIQHAHLLRRILAVNLMGSGCFLVLVGLAQRDGAVDPVPHALVLTGYRGGGQRHGLRPHPDAPALCGKRSLHPPRRG